MTEMSEHDTQIIGEAVKESKNTKLRWWMWILGVFALTSFVTALTTFWIIWHHKQNQVDAGKNLAIQVQTACKQGYLRGELCSTAKSVEQEAKAGPQGPPGAAGGAGPQGPAGPKGDKGDPGPMGPTGPAGRNGSNGINGSNGGPGPVGASGSPGPEGDTGQQGPQGEKGDKGDKGDTGDAGPVGPKGESAFPFTFQFTIPASLDSPAYVVTVVCTASDACTSTVTPDNGGIP